MRIPQIYYVMFKFEKDGRDMRLTYFGLHWSWDATWSRLRELEEDKGKEYVGGGVLSWKNLFIVLIPGNFFRKEVIEIKEG